MLRIAAGISLDLHHDAAGLPFERHAGPDRWLNLTIWRIQKILVLGRTTQVETGKPVWLPSQGALWAFIAIRS